MAYLNRENDYGGDLPEMASPAPEHPTMQDEIKRLRKVIAKAQTLANKESIEVDSLFRDDGEPCTGGGKLWRQKWAQQLDAILAGAD